MLKAFSPLVKHDVLYFFSSYINVMWVWVCNEVERGIERVHFEFHYK